MEKVCTDVVILKKGNVLSSGKVEQLLTENKRIELGSNDLSALRNSIQSFAGISNIQDRNGFLIADLADELDAASINKQLQEKGILLNHLVVVKSDLESEFLKLVQK